MDQEETVWEKRFFTRMNYRNFFNRRKKPTMKTSGVEFLNSPAPIKTTMKRPKPNSVCPFCASQKKFKKCCGR